MLGTWVSRRLRVRRAGPGGPDRPARRCVMTRMRAGPLVIVLLGLSAAPAAFGQRRTVPMPVRPMPRVIPPVVNPPVVNPPFVTPPIVTPPIVTPIPGPVIVPSPFINPGVIPVPVPTTPAVVPVPVPGPTVVVPSSQASHGVKGASGHRTRHRVRHRRHATRRCPPHRTSGRRTARSSRTHRVARG